MNLNTYIYIYITILFVLILHRWKIKKNVPHYQIADVIFRDEHIDFKRDILKDLRNPWIFPIGYCVKDSVNEANVMKAIEAIEAIENNTCIKFEKKDDCDNTTQELIFKQGDYCASNVGHIPKNHSQIIWLTPECYGNPYIILHEIGHTLGLIHEHTRTDKDRYVTIDYYSLYENEISNFRIRNDSRFKNYSTAYDYSAIMHYAPYDFSTFWRWAFGYPVIKSKLFWEHSRMMGQRKKMTYNEYKRINLCHCNWCNWVDNSTGKRIKLHTTECKNSG